MDANYPDVVLRPGGRRCRVVYSYTPQNEDELQLQVEDEIEFISEVEEGWWRGKLNDTVGVFPSNFVVDIPAASEEASLSEGDLSAPLSSPEEVPALPPKPIKELCRVIYPYAAAVEDELTLEKDDIVTIITKDVEDKGWWKGELHGKVGLFPDNFVEIISPADERTQIKKPERPAKNIGETKIDSKIPLITQLGNKKMDETSNNNTAPNESEVKRRSADLDLIKPDTVASHRKSLEQKVANEAPIAGKKPPVSGKPKPLAATKPQNVIRLRGESLLNDLPDGAVPSKSANLSRLHGKVISNDIEDGVTSSKPAVARKSLDSEAEDMDLDIVGRSDMLSHITQSRPRAPGRRPPSVFKENENVSPITNGNSDVVEPEKTPPKENKWEKHKPPFMKELKENLKSTKPATTNAATIETRNLNVTPWGTKIGSQSTSESTSTSSVIGSETVSKTSTSASSASTDIRQMSSSSTSSTRLETISSKISELSSVFAEKSKGHSSLSADTSSHDYASKKEVSELRLKVDKLEKLANELMGQLLEEADKRRILEKELNKLTDLVTQV